MADQIRIRSEQMRIRASQYRAEAENVQGVISRMDNLLSLLQSEWEGASSEAYAEQYHDLRPDFVKAQELIAAIAESLDAVATIIESADQDIARQF